MSKFLGRPQNHGISHAFPWLHRCFFWETTSFFCFCRDNSIGSWTKGPGRPNPRLGRAGKPAMGESHASGSRSFAPVFLWYFVDLNIKKDQQDINKMIINSLLYIYIYAVYYSDIEHNIEDNTITYYYIEYL